MTFVFRAYVTALIGSLALAGCGSGSGAGGGSGGGSTATGGANASGGSGGSSATGGSSASGGATGSGGAKNTGGSTGSGGSVASGGATGSGGSAAGGGGTGTGGSSGAGGAPATGGATGGGGAIANPTQPLSPNIVVDQFGYRTGDEKIAVIRNPQTGFDSSVKFTPGAKYALCDASGTKVFEAAPAQWNSGATDSSSGDKAWWFDFSTVTTAGSYFVLDETQNVRSAVFSISDGVYKDVLVQATRMLFYQRDGFAKTAQYAGADWVDGAAHTGMCYLYNDSTKTLNKDLHGGWWDAGDFNKYTNWGASDVIELMHAYVDTPSAFTDGTNIPESGNGIADLLDEVKWELDWIGRMQQSDGSVLSVVDEPAAPGPASGGNTAPSTVTTPCFYGPASTSAALTSAAAWAYASVVFGAASGASTAYPGYAAGLVTKAQQAWTWAQANPSVFFYNSKSNPTVAAGDQEVDSSNQAYGLLVKKLQAALYLFEATGTTSYRDFFDANYSSINLIKSGYSDGSHGEEQETLLEYIHAPNATASVVSAIKSKYLGSLQTSSNLGAVTGSPDPYLAYLTGYWWGINQIKSDQGNLLYDVVTFGIDAGTNANAIKGAERYIHWLHGVNPLQLVYLSNMGAQGATKSVTRFFHSWYAKGSNWDAVGVSKYGPPPGYLTGGPNPSYTWDGCCPSGCGTGNSCGGNAMPSPPSGQPSQKSYLDFNDGWPLDSWSVTEPDDGYQAKYIRLLSKFAP